MSNWYAAEVLGRLQEARVRKKVTDAWMIRDAIQKNTGRKRSIFVRVFIRGIRLIPGKFGRKGRTLSP